jgi:hypothetical protein
MYLSTIQRRSFGKTLPWQLAYEKSEQECVENVENMVWSCLYIEGKSLDIKELVFRKNLLFSYSLPIRNIVLIVYETSSYLRQDQTLFSTFRLQSTPDFS